MVAAGCVTEQGSLWHRGCAHIWVLGIRKSPSRPYHNLLCCPDSVVCLSLLELISCPGCQRVYLTRDVTEHIFLQCFSPVKPTMARVSQDKGICRRWFTEIDDIPVYRSSIYH